MNEILIQKYINNITLNDIINFGKNEGINISNSEAKILYEYMHKYWRKFYYEEPKDLMLELKNKLSSSTYNKLYELYYIAKEKIKNK